MNQRAFHVIACLLITLLCGPGMAVTTACRIALSRLVKGEPLQHEVQNVALQSSRYEGDVAPPLPTGLRKSDADKTFVSTGRYKDIPPGHQVVTSNLRICNVVMFRNRKSGRLVFYHYWEVDDYNLWKLDQIRDSFDPESLEVVLFGNKSSTSLSIIENHLSRRVNKLKCYTIDEKSRWEFLYDQEADQIFYQATDTKNTVLVKDVFGKEAAASAGHRNPEYDFELNVRKAQEDADRVANALSYLVNEMEIPAEFQDLPHSEKELRLLWVQKLDKLLSLPIRKASQKQTAETALTWQKKILQNKFAITPN